MFLELTLDDDRQITVNVDQITHISEHSDYKDRSLVGVNGMIYAVKETYVQVKVALEQVSKLHGPIAPQQYVYAIKPVKEAPKEVVAKPQK